jgi:hypothetical protein
VNAGVALLFASTLLAAGCSDGADAPQPPPPAVTVDASSSGWADPNPCSTDPGLPTDPNGTGDPSDPTTQVPCGVHAVRGQLPKSVAPTRPTRL